MSTLDQIAYSGVRAAQIALSTTGQNIANVNTPGFSRLHTVAGSVAGQSALNVGGGVQVTSMMLEHDPTARVLILSASGEQDDVLEAIKAGATGYLVKSASSAELIDAVTRVADGDTVFTPGLAGLVLGEFRRIADGPADDPRDQLTERETEILKMVATGMSYKQIAARLVLSHRTVQNHVQNTLRKLQMNNRVQLTRWAIEHGLDDDA